MLLRVRTWLEGQWRLLRPGHNPLARRLDRIEAGVLCAAIVLCLAAVPAAISAGVGTYAHEIAVSRLQVAQRHPSSAVTLADAPPAVATADGAPTVPPSAVPGRWETSGGAERTGVITVPPGTRAGSTIPIWLDHNGDVTARPLAAGDASTLALGAGLLTWILAAAVVAGLVALTRWVLNRRRAAAWHAAWERFRHQQTRS